MTNIKNKFPTVWISIKNQDDKREVDQETQTVMLYLANDNRIRRFILDTKHILNWDYVKHLNDKREAIVQSVSMTIRGQFVEAINRINSLVQTNSALGDLLTIAVSRVDWHAIAEYLLENIE